METAPYVPAAEQEQEHAIPANSRLCRLLCRLREACRQTLSMGTTGDFEFATEGSSAIAGTFDRRTKSMFALPADNRAIARQGRTKESTVNPQPMQDQEYSEPRNFFHRAKNWFFGDEGIYAEEETEPQQDGEARKRSHINLHTTRSGRVSVRRNALNLTEAKAPADGLKAGQQQIVNLERATLEESQRIIDFLNGVCYALDGTYEQIGTRVYMFVPANVTVEVDEAVNSDIPSSNRRMQYSE